MHLMTNVEHYIFAALERAVLDPDEDGVFAAYVPDCPGVVAFGTDVHSCARELYDRLEDWVKVSLRNGQPLPVIDGIDLNSDASKILATYHSGMDDFPQHGEIYKDEAALEEAFRRSNFVA